MLVVTYLLGRRTSSTCREKSCFIGVAVDADEVIVASVRCFWWRSKPLPAVLCEPSRWRGEARRVVCDGEHVAWGGGARGKTRTMGV